MPRKRWFVVALATAALVVGVAGGTVLANEGETSDDSPVKNLVSRVASILGLEESQVQDAFDRATTEMQDEALQSRLDQMVADGRLTQEQADEQRDWYQSRPDTIAPGSGFMFGGHGKFGGRGWFGHRWHGRGHCPGQITTPTPEDTTGTTPEAGV